MKQKLKKIFTNWKILLLLAFLIFSIVAINPDFDPKGVSITHIEFNSSASNAGMISPKSTISPRSREVISSMMGSNIKTMADYYTALDMVYSSEPFEQVIIKTNKRTYSLSLQPEVEVELTKEIETIVQKPKEDIMGVFNTATGTPLILTNGVNKGANGIYIIIDINNNLSGSYKIVDGNIYGEATGTYVELMDNTQVDTYLAHVEGPMNLSPSSYLVQVLGKLKTQNKTIERTVGVKDIGLQVKAAPSSNIKKGLDLEGGTRIILKPTENISNEKFELLLASMKQRIDVYGLSNVNVRSTVDFTLNPVYIVVEIPGANEEEVKNLISKQGEFEARISNKTVFSGGDDIKTVLQTPEQSGIDPTSGCGINSDNTWSCRYFFIVILSSKAAERQANATAKLDVITVNEQGQVLKREEQYLSEQILFYLDDKKTDALNVGAGLKGNPAIEIRISGTASGNNQAEATDNALQEMKRMQTLILTGSLPSSIDVVETSTISATLGKEFLNNAILVAIITLITMIVVIFIIYKKVAIVASMFLTVLSEIVLILGLAATLNAWSLDLAAIAGIIIVIGTGVDHLIIITDETLRKTIESLTWLQKIKRSFNIIIVAGLTTVVAMFPLLFAGAGLLKGFALTTMIGVTVGVLIARPAYGAAIEILLKH